MHNSSFHWKQTIIASLGGIITAIILFALTFPNAFDTLSYGLKADIAGISKNTPIAGETYYTINNNSIRIYSNINQEVLYTSIIISKAPGTEVLAQTAGIKAQEMSPTMVKYTIPHKELKQGKKILEVKYNAESKSDISVGDVIMITQGDQGIIEQNLSITNLDSGH